MRHCPNHRHPSPTSRCIPWTPNLTGPTSAIKSEFEVAAHSATNEKEEEYYLWIRGVDEGHDEQKAQDDNGSNRFLHGRLHVRETQGVEYAQSRLLLLLLAPRRRQASRSLENSHNWGGHSPRCQRVSFVSKCQRNGLSKVKFPFFSLFFGKAQVSPTINHLDTHLHTHTHTERDTGTGGKRHKTQKITHVRGHHQWLGTRHSALSLDLLLSLFVCFLFSCSTWKKRKISQPRDGSAAPVQMSSGFYNEPV